ncbi:MAG: enoyl-CoA hydratase/isomerase family protein, partial [Hyphomicrobiales bacterium]|nr:enoyl-CoA hydratase/isomerase family protein [Hyphomicrobiales bacterium]
MPIRFNVAEHVARVTIDRPEVMNAIDAASERELQRIWREIEKDREVRVVVLTGAGDRAFSAGADMKGGSGGSGLDYWANER